MTLSIGYRIVVQARTSSSRLPGKALLPLGGISAAVLAARRAGRDGADVVVATSTDDSDDVLAETLRAAGVRVLRGPLDDVQRRFAQATADLPGDAVVVRLTADNAFPDAEFVGQLVEDLEREGDEYLGTRSPQDDLPYGLSAEAFRVRVLRAALGRVGDDADREHVTPRMRARYGRRIFRPDSAPPGLGRLRCTVDSFDDYQRVARVFAGVDDPVGASWLELCERLAALPGAPRFRVPVRVLDGAVHGEMVLGAVQLGLDYGRTNDQGRPGADESVEIIRTALAHGVTHLDTARAYGESEARIGTALAGGWSGRAHVISKLDPLRGLPENAERAQVEAAVDASVLRSCRELGLASVPTLLLHRAEHRTSHGGRIWERLRDLRAEGVIGRLGVSVQGAKEAIETLADPDVAHIQLPFNLLDRRWRTSGFVRLRDRRPDIVVHARSVLLQGLLITGDTAPWPYIPGYRPESVLRKIEELCARLGTENALELSLAYVRAKRWIDGVLVGVATHDQLMENLRMFTRPPLDGDGCAEVEAAFDGLPEALLNPALWPS
jgi:spore coat polysaccharide biosynthesis protein SpsF (cytidylyltransferase family)/aryl-alcohol dehydrogenase-like predicted oxidoreductase